MNTKFQYQAMSSTDLQAQVKLLPPHNKISPEMYFANNDFTVWECLSVDLSINEHSTFKLFLLIHLLLENVCAALGGREGMHTCRYKYTHMHKNTGEREKKNTISLLISIQDSKPR